MVAVVVPQVAFAVMLIMILPQRGCGLVFWGEGQEPLTVSNIGGFVKFLTVMLAGVVAFLRVKSSVLATAVQGRGDDELA